MRKRQREVQRHIEVPDWIHEKLKIRSAKEGRPMREIASRALEKELEIRRRSRGK
jgi:hypothetical protein